MSNPERERAQSPYATTAAKLPALPAVRSTDASLQRWLDGARVWFETRSGARDPFERAVTVRDLVQLGLVDGAMVARGGFGMGTVDPSTINGAELPILTNAGPVRLSIDAFAKSILDTALFRELMKRLDDPSRFDSFPDEVRQILARSIADEAAARGADVRRLEAKVQEANRSLAYKVEEVTASFDGAMAGVRETAFASATATRAMAGQVTQVEARLDSAPVDPDAILPTVYTSLANLEASVPVGVQGKYYQVDNPTATAHDLYRWDGTGYVLAGSGNFAAVEQQLIAIADRATGLESRYTVKVQAGGALAGFGLAATENDEGATSAFIVAADKFAVVAAGDTIADPLNPPANRVPFGIDTTNNTIYINGNVRINAGGPQLSGLTGTEKTVVVFAYKRSASAPADNPGDGGTYDFGTKTLTGLANGWSATIPAANGNPLYVRAATASSSGATDTILGAEWSGAVVMAQDGTAGAAGLNSATVQLYRRTTTSTAPTISGTSPANDLTYTFATGALTGTPPSGWSTTIPAASNGGYLWTVRATAANTAATDTITVSEWSAVQALAQDGAVKSVSCYTDIGTQTFTLNGNGTGANESAGIQLRRNLVGFAGNGAGTTTWSLASGSFTGAFTTLSETDGRMANVTYDEMGSDAVTFKCTYTEGGVTAEDYITLYRSKDGIGAYLTNESHTLPASNTGVVSGYTGATGTFKVSDGGRDVATSQLAFSVQSYTGFSGGGGISINSSGVYTVSSGIQDASDVATVTLRCVYTRALGTAVTIDRVFTITKAKQGLQGTGGDPGARGSLTGYGNVYGIYDGGTWSNAKANRVISNLINNESLTSDLATTTHLRVGDTVTLTNAASATSSRTRVWAGGSGWIDPGVIINGNLIVTGTVASDKIAANAITAAKIAAGEITADKITSSTTAYGNIVFAMGSSATLASRNAGLAVQSTSGGRFAALFANTSNISGAGGIGVGVNNGSSYAASFVNANDTSFTQFRTKVELAQNQQAGIFTNYQGDYTTKDSEVLLCENANAVQITAGMFRYDRTLETGSGTATFSGTKPGGAQTNEWLRINVNGVDKLIPVWTAA